MNDGVAYCAGECFSYNSLNFAKYYKEINEILNKLVFLLQNELSYPLSGRQLQLLDKYFNFYPQAHFVYQLPTVIKLLEILPTKINENDIFATYFQRYLEVCFTPPLLLNSSELINCEKDLEEYFSVLGSLLFYITTEIQRNIILDAIISLLDRKCPLPPCFISLKTLQNAAVKSKLPVIITRFLTFAPEDVYEKFLAITNIFAETSKEACYNIILNGAVESLLIRIEPTWRERAFIKAPPKPNVNNQLIHYEASNIILWKLLRSVRDTDKTKFGAIRVFPLWSLKYALEYFCLRKLNKTDRNNVLALLLEILIKFDETDFLKSGLAEDIIALNMIGENANYNSNWNEIEISACNEDFVFTKLLLLFLPLYRKEQYYGGIKLLRESNLIACKLKLLGGNQAIAWHPDHHNSLAEVTIYSLFSIIPVTLDVFLAEKGILKITSVFLDNAFCPNVALTLIISLITVVTASDTIEQKILVNRIIDVKVLTNIIVFMEKILLAPVLDTTYQMLLSCYFILLETIFSGKFTITNPRLIKLSLEILKRSLNPKDEDPVIDLKLPICVISCLWNILLCDEFNMKQFFQNDGVYLILDIMEKFMWPVKIIALGLLSELSEEPLSIPFFITWRGNNKKKIVPYLLELFREENKLLGVKTSPEGAILDPELPLMGKDQWMETYQENSNLMASPSISDIVGSVRSKIYAILQMLIYVYDEEVRKSNEIYKMFNEDLDLKDKVTMVIAINYFALKLGEVWNELDLYFKKSAIKPVADDYETLSVVLRRAQKWGIHIQQLQQKYFKEDNEREVIRENMFYTKIRESKLCESLKAYRELDYISRCTSSIFRIKNKRKQRIHLVQTELYPKDPNILYHMTYMYDINVNPVFNQILYIASNDNVETPNPKRETKDQVFLLPPSTKTQNSFEELKMDSNKDEDLLWGLLQP